ncbi:MAG: GspMb/PilO family protein [bacterium]
MKLPQSPKERIQVFVLIGIGAAALLFAVVTLGLAQRDMHIRNTLEADKLTDALAKADREVHAMVFAGEEYRRLQEEISLAISNNIIQPVLGSYLLSVRDRLEQMARRMDVKLAGIQEVVLPMIPAAAGKTNRTFRSYGVQLTGTAGYAQLQSFLKELEASNPYLSITDLSITGNAGDPNVQAIAMRIEWPVMISAAIPASAGGAK